MSAFHVSLGLPPPPEVTTRGRPRSRPSGEAVPPARLSPSQNGGGGYSVSGWCGQAGIGEDGGGSSVRAGRAGAGVGLLRLGPGPVLAAGLGDAARRCHHPLGGHGGREDPAAGERRGELPTAALPRRRRRQGEPLPRAVWRGTGPVVPGGPGTGVCRGELASLAKRGFGSRRSPGARRRGGRVGGSVPARG